MLWNRHRVLALAPPVAGGASFVIAAGRSGVLGVLDAKGDGARAIDELTRFGVTEYAVRIDAERVAEPWIAEAVPGPTVIICPSPWNAEVLAEACAKAHASGRRIVGEVVSAAEADQAIAAGVDGLIVVGNEAGGRVGADSTFILLQSVLARTELPVWARGGVGPRVASGCVAAGAAGVVLDGAALLVRESPLAGLLRDALRHWDGGETQLIESADGRAIRVDAPPNSAVLSRLRDAARQGGEVWTRAMAEDVGWDAGQAWPIGQDAAFATELAAIHVTLGGVVQAVEKAVEDGIRGARDARPLAEGSVAGDGPRLSVPDPPGADDPGQRRGRRSRRRSPRKGACRSSPWPCCGSPEVERLLRESAQRLEGRPWGVGLLGFVPPELRREQLAAVLAAKPPFALIAGGRPDQAVELEREGITTYLHVPSPGLLDQFLRAGSRRFVLEGRECGGHVGPRSSFVLWEQGCRVIEKAIDAGAPADSFSLVFAGGIHDARSAAAVAALAGDLAARGVRIGVLMGTAYLFTHEAVATGAIVPRYQREAAALPRDRAAGDRPGAPGPRRQDAVRRSVRGRAPRGLIAERKSHDEIRETLEALNARPAADRDQGGRAQERRTPRSAGRRGRRRPRTASTCSARPPRCATA